MQLVGPGPLRTALKWAADVGAALAAVLLLGLAALGALAYRNPAMRRSVGIVWDIGTFWPRAAHPLAPPCYAERSIPHLVTRITNQRDCPAVILAGHSQGSTLAVATVLQLPEAARQRLHLLTFGTQLNRLYGRVFPAFFGRAPLRAVARRLAGEHGPRWRSFYRATDPIGYPVDVTVDGWAVDHPGAVPLRPLADPSALRPSDGEVVDPPIRNHSTYPVDDTYRAVRDQTAQDLLARLPPPACRPQPR